ncbi:MAG: hypothetical protein ACE5JQ_00685 [Candidatus Methylomirabilales bacterium]
MTRKRHTHRILYRLTCEDVETVAGELGISRDKLTNDLLYQV